MVAVTMCNILTTSTMCGVRMLKLTKDRIYKDEHFLLFDRYTYTYDDKPD